MNVNGNFKDNLMGKKKVIFIICLIFAVALIAAILHMVSGGGKDSAKNILYADKVSVITGNGSGTVNRFAGVVEAQDTLKISLSEGQKVKEIFVEKGQEVEPGTKLFEYDTEELAMTLEQGNLELEKIGNSISNLNSQIAALTTEKKNAPAGEQLSYTTQIQELQTNVKQEEYNYKVKELEVNRTKKSLESSTVTSTIAGIIQEINPDPGYDDYSGEKQAFMSILSTGKYRIKGKISEQNIGELQPGMDVTVRARNNQEEIWKGSVDVIDTEKPESSSQSEMYSGSDSSARATKYPFYVTLETSDGLMLGQHVYIEPDEGQDEKKAGIWLNDYFIVDADTDSPYVWIANGQNKLEKRDVILGQYDEDLGEYEIADGLSEKDKIAFPTDELKEGMSVAEGTADQTTAAMWDDSEDDESSDDSAYTESDGSEPEMIEDGASDSDMMDATDDISSGDDLVPMEGAPTE
mgnify:CR=1 FL=1